MRKILTILAILGMAVGISTLNARADGVTYTVHSTYASNVPMTIVSEPGASFGLSFTVPSTVTGDFSPSGTNGFVDLSPIQLTISPPGSPSFSEPATIDFAPIGSFGLFDVETMFGGNDFLWSFVGPQVFTLNGTETVATFLTGPFAITPGTDFSASFFADLVGGGAGDLTSPGSVEGAAVTAPEPASLLLLGSGFLVLGGFARKRLSARFN